jgi:hypothetical protein
MRGECIGHAFCNPVALPRDIPRKVAAPLSVMIVSRAHLSGVGYWYPRTPVTQEYAGAIVWINPVNYTYEDITYIRGLPEWLTQPKNMTEVLNPLREPSIAE